MARVLRLIPLLIGLGLLCGPAGASALEVGVSGNHLVDGAGQPVRLLGVNRSGSEYHLLELRRHARR